MSVSVVDTPPACCRSVLQDVYRLNHPTHLHPLIPIGYYLMGILQPTADQFKIVEKNTSTFKLKLTLNETFKTVALGTYLFCTGHPNALLHNYGILECVFQCICDTHCKCSLDYAKRAFYRAMPYLVNWLERDDCITSNYK